jgi:hypothetical protein
VGFSGVAPNTTGVFDVAYYDDGAGSKLHARSQLGVHRFDGTGASGPWTLTHPISGSTGLYSTEAYFLRTLPHLNGFGLYTGGHAVGFGNHLERFDGVSWNPVGLGYIDGELSSIEAFDDGHGWGLFVTGDFLTPGGVSSGGIAQLVIPSPTILSHPADQTVGFGQPMTLTVSAVGAPPLAYQWTRGGSSIAGATGASLSIAAAGLADAGSYEVLVWNGCGIVNSHPANVSVRGCNLTIWQPFGPGVLAVAHSGGPPLAHVFTAFSLLPDNLTNMGGGAVFGLHISLDDAVAQFLTQAPPFVTTLSGGGASFWAAGPLPPWLIGVTVWGVSTLYQPSPLAALGSPSNFGQCLIQ